MGKTNFAPFGTLTNVKQNLIANFIFVDCYEGVCKFSEKKKYLKKDFYWIFTIFN